VADRPGGRSAWCHGHHGGPRPGWGGIRRSRRSVPRHRGG